MKVAGCKLRFSSTLLEAKPKHVERNTSAQSKNRRHHRNWKAITGRLSKKRNPQPGCVFVFQLHFHLSYEAYETQLYIVYYFFIFNFIYIRYTYAHTHAKGNSKKVAGCVFGTCRKAQLATLQPATLQPSLKPLPVPKQTVSYFVESLSRLSQMLHNRLFLAREERASLRIIMQ